jgi:hypothetical protein
MNVLRRLRLLSPPAHRQVPRARVPQSRQRRPLSLLGNLRRSLRLRARRLMVAGVGGWA